MSLKYRIAAIGLALLLMPGPVVAQSKQVASPGSFVPQSALAFGRPGETAKPVTEDTPLPTRAADMAPASTPALTGVSTGPGLVGPFRPQLGRVVTVALSASSWAGGNAQLLRSTDNGATTLPLTPGGVTVGVWSGQGVDQPWVETEKGATLWLYLPFAGITYRVS